MMDSLRTETEAALAGVLSLCTVTDDDVNALQRHDDAALASLDINDVDAAKVGSSVELAYLCVVYSAS